MKVAVVRHGVSISPAEDTNIFKEETSKIERKADGKPVGKLSVEAGTKKVSVKGKRSGNRQSDYRNNSRGIVRAGNSNVKVQTKREEKEDKGIYNFSSIDNEYGIATFVCEKNSNLKVCINLKSISEEFLNELSGTSEHLETIKTLENDLETSTENYNILTDNYNSLKQTNAELESELNSARETITSLEYINTELQDLIDNSNESVDESCEKVCECESLKERIKELEESLAKYSNLGDIYSFTKKEESEEEKLLIFNVINGTGEIAILNPGNIDEKDLSKLFGSAVLLHYFETIGKMFPVYSSEISRLNKELTVADKSVADLQSEVENKDVEISDLKHKLSSKDSEIEKLYGFLQKANESLEQSVILGDDDVSDDIISATFDKINVAFGELSTLSSVTSDENVPNIKVIVIPDGSGGYCKDTDGKVVTVVSINDREIIQFGNNLIAEYPASDIEDNKQEESDQESSNEE